MKQIFILTACSKNAKEHYKDTIENLIDFNELYENKIINQRAYKKILAEFPSGKARTWGNLPTKEDDVYLDEPQNSYEQLEVGDTLFTYINWSERSKRIDVVTNCALKFRDEKLAKALWGVNDDGETWEYIFLLRDTTFLDFPSKKLFDSIGYKKAPIGLTRVSEERVKKLLAEKGDLHSFIEEMEKPTIEDIEEDKGKIIKPDFDVIPEKKTKKKSKAYRSEPDYEHQQRENKKTGDDGELRVLKKEKELLIQNGRKDLSEKVEYTAKDVDPNAGYDIKSFHLDGRLKYIEVKSTQSSMTISNSFYLTAKELKVAKEKKDDYYVYMVFNARDNNYKIVPIENFISQINKSVEIEPVNYQCRVYLKK